MSTYTRELGVDFTATEIHISSFYNELNEASLPNVEAIYQAGNDVTVKFSTTLSGSELITFDTICANYEFIIYDNTFALIKDIKSVGTNGGSSVANTWTTRDLNTLEGNQNFVTLASNQFTLNETGSYQIRVEAPASNVQNHQIRLYDTVSSSVIATGTSAYSQNKTVTYSTIDTVIVKGATQMVLEVQHITEKTNSRDGFGIASAFNTSELYTVVSILRV